MNKISTISLVLILNYVISFPNLKFQKTTTVSYREHLNIEHIKNVCGSRKEICASNDTNVCAVRKTNETFEYRDFENSCYLFMSNMCEEPEHEFSIASAGSCYQYKSRRNLAISTTSHTSTGKPKFQIATSTQPSTLYEVYDAFDSHVCPLSCHDVYSPVCVGVNRGHGLYFKFFTFINHCAADIYYCKHWREFAGPPDEDELVNSSPLSWSFCAANRYIQFARFAEMTSSMGHYGWLAGDYKPTHILDNKERLPGYG